MAKKYIVTLSAEERQVLQDLITSGTHRARKLTRARILLKADEGWPDQEISRALNVSIPTIERVRQRFVLEGFEAALNQKKPHREYRHKIDGEHRDSNSYSGHGDQPPGTEQVVLAAGHIKPPGGGWRLNTEPKEGESCFGEDDTCKFEDCKRQQW